MKQQYDEAIRNYSQAIQIDPANLEAFNNLAIVYKKLNEMDKANDALNQALAIDPGHAGTNYNLAVLNEDNGHLTPALHYYRRFVNLGENTHPNLVFQVKQHIQTLAE